MDALLIITDLLVLLFWVRFWAASEQEFYFNPFLSAPARLTDRVVDFLRPVLPLPGRLTALLLVAFVLAFRAVALQHFFAENWPWTVTIGPFFAFTPRQPGVHGALLFSLLDFLFFIARFWGLYLFVQALTPVMRRDRGSEAFHVAAMPLSAQRWWLQLLLLVATHAVLVYELTRVGVATLHAAEGMPHSTAPMLPDVSTADHLLHLGWLTALSLADALQAGKACMLAFIIGSFVSLLLQNAALNAVCNEGVSVLLGRFARRIPVGMLDFTPILYFFGVNILYVLICYAVMVLMTAARPG